MSRTPRALAVVALGAAAGLMVSAAAPAGADTVRFTPGAPGAGDPYFPDMGNGGFDVSHYDIALRYDPKTKAIQAVTTVTARATQDLSRFDLDFQGPLKISSLTVDGRPASYTRSGAQELVITPRKGLREHRRFQVRAVYSGVPQTINDPALGVSGWVPTADGGIMLNQPIGAATVYPVNDHPTDKATYSFALTAPKDLTSLANGDLTGTRTAGGLTTTRWEMRSPMASELAMVAFGRYDVVNGRTKGGVPNLTATDRAMAISAADAPRPCLSRSYASAISCMSAYSMPLCTILTKWPAPSWPTWVTQGSPSATAAIERKIGPSVCHDSSDPPGMIDGPSSAPSSPPEMPVPTKWMPVALMRASRAMVSRKLALPPSTMMSPGSKTFVSSSMTASVPFPACTMMIAVRGVDRREANSS